MKELLEFYLLKLNLFFIKLAGQTSLMNIIICLIILSINYVQNIFDRIF